VDRYQCRAKPTPRATSVLRGLGYWSKFVRDFHYSRAFVDFHSRLANREVCPHSFGMNIGHTNIGKVENAGADVDKWHFDSVDYVLVIILSDLTNMVGGELELLREELGGEESMQKLNAMGEPDRSNVANLNYVGAGYGIFVQGSKILHRVTPVLQANAARISMVISFQTPNPFVEDTTRTLKVFSDPDNIAAWEFARHSAWKVKSQLSYIIDKSNPDDMSKEDLVKMLQAASEKLCRATNILQGELDDAIAFLDPNAIKTMPKSRL